MFDLITIGEYLIDFTPAGQGKMGNPAYEMNPGGAPCNCAAAFTALGGTSSMISAVGDDLFGRFLLSKLKYCCIDGGGIQITPHAPTTLAFVSLSESGEREFAFVRNPGADTMIQQELLDFNSIESCRNLHFGSLSLCREPALSSTMAAVRHAKKHNRQISFDPNYRAPLWPNVQAAVDAMQSGLKFADVVKMSEEEMELILGVPQSDPAAGARILLDSDVSTCYITCGRQGAYYADASAQGFVEGFSVNALDTTGCGDAFMGTALYLQLNMPDIKIKERVRMANAVGALCATKPGGMMAMPSMDELQAFLVRA